MDYTPDPNEALWSSRPPRRGFAMPFSLGLFFFIILLLSVFGVFVYMFFFLQSSLGKLPF